MGWERESFVLWFTGLSGSGKSTLAQALEQTSYFSKRPTEYLDGDELRARLNFQKFDNASRDLYIRSVALMASTLERNGISSIVSLISPFEETRKYARSVCKNFYLVHLSTPLEVCEMRDPKGLYKKARTGGIREFTGLTSPFEPPTHVDLSLDTSRFSISECIAKILTLIKAPERNSRAELQTY